jgi:hypothetical protein
MLDVTLAVGRHKPNARTACRRLGHGSATFTKCRLWMLLTANATGGVGGARKLNSFGGEK